MQIASELRRYLAVHPRAADTLLGVGRWWLPQGLAQQALPEEIEEALEILVAEGRLDRRALPDGSVLYRGRTPTPVP